MCGIVGCFPQQRISEISNSLGAIAHRGPDAKGIFEVSRGTLGHVRLAILDVIGGHQPMTERDASIVFNGEIYNYRDLRSRLSEPVSTDSDTEIVLKLYRSQGPSFVSLLDGMFAVAILDEGGLFLARDPLGIKPLYYAFDDEMVWFASEIKALMGRSANVQEFPPGHWWHSRHGLQQYYNIDGLRQSERATPVQADDQALAQIQTVLREAVYKRLIADETVPVGVSLSGGLDSSIIAALACEVKTPLSTFTVGMAGSSDIQASRQMADYLNTQHHAYTYTFDEMLRALPEVIYYLESFDAPLVRSAIPNYFLAKLAASHVKVILLGEGADELFAGYRYLATIDDAQALDHELRLITSKLHNTNLQRADRMTMAHGIEGRVPFLDAKVVSTIFGLPADWKLLRSQQPEKELLRRSVADLLPENIVWRPKQKFSDGAGSMDMLSAHANEVISDSELAHHRETPGNPSVRSKEELLYYYAFRGIFGDAVSPASIGMTRSITQDELN